MRQTAKVLFALIGLWTTCAGAETGWPAVEAPKQKYGGAWDWSAGSDARPQGERRSQEPRRERDSQWNKGRADTWSNLPYESGFDGTRRESDYRGYPSERESQPRQHTWGNLSGDEQFQQERGSQRQRAWGDREPAPIDEPGGRGQWYRAPEYYGPPPQYGYNRPYYPGNGGYSGGGGYYPGFGVYPGLGGARILPGIGPGLWW